MDGVFLHGFDIVEHEDGVDVGLPLFLYPCPGVYAFVSLAPEGAVEFYDFIPGIGIKKGFVYGLILWVTTIVHMAILSTLYGPYEWPFQDIIAGFISLCIVYGPLIGILYKKE